MKLTRLNGEIVILTPEEALTVYYAVEKSGMEEDLRDMLIEALPDGIPEDLDEEMTERLIAAALPHLRRIYGDSPVRGDAYWEARRDALKEAWKECCNSDGEPALKQYTVTFSASGGITVLARSAEEVRAMIEGEAAEAIEADMYQELALNGLQIDEVYEDE